MRSWIKQKSALYFLLELLALTVLIIGASLIVASIGAQAVAEQHPNNWRMNLFAGMGWIVYGWLAWVIYLITWFTRLLREIDKKKKQNESVKFHLLLVFAVLLLLLKMFSPVL